MTKLSYNPNGMAEIYRFKKLGVVCLQTILWEKFEVESDKDGKLYFISCHTGNVMQCNKEGFTWCDNKNRPAWEAWTIGHPKSTARMTSGLFRTISLAVTGSIFLPLLGIVAGCVNL
jgi:hypothetical protein